MKHIDIDNWSRKNHFLYFKEYSNPHLSLSADVDVTKLYKFCKENKISSFKAVLYIAIHTANSIKEFRQRIRNNEVVEHDAVHASFTVSVKDDLFSFCNVNYQENFSDFYKLADTEMEKVKHGTYLPEGEEEDDLVYMTTIPWVSFTNIMHPLNLPADSTPRISWGKYFEINGLLKMPLSVQAHHSLVDGIHIGKYFNTFQELANNPEKLIP